MLRDARVYFKNIINKKYPNWDISIALRYLPIIEDLKRHYCDGDTILEVGSEITGITTYFQKPVTGVDVEFDYSKVNEYLTPVKGSVLDLPFSDQSYDYVISVDMLEHIPPRLREKAIKEMIRVTRKKMYLSFPCGGAAENVDKELDEYYLNLTGQRYQYLKEHTKLGLPNYKETKKLLEQFKRFKLKEYNNTSIFLWRLLLKWGLSGDKLKSSLYRRALLLLPFLKYVNFGQSYRKLFVLERVDR